MKYINDANKEICIPMLCWANGETFSYWYFARTVELRIVRKDMKAGEVLSLKQ